MSITVSIPTILRSFTANARSVDAEGSSLAEVIGDLDSLLEDSGADEAEVLSLLEEVAGRHGVDLHIDRQPGHTRAIEVTAPSQEAIVSLGEDLHYEFGAPDSFSEEDFLAGIGDIEEV